MHHSRWTLRPGCYVALTATETPIAREVDPDERCDDCGALPLSFYQHRRHLRHEQWAVTVWTAQRRCGATTNSRIPHHPCHCRIDEGRVAGR
jgi:hypothetical protein